MNLFTSAETICKVSRFFFVRFSHLFQQMSGKKRIEKHICVFGFFTSYFNIILCLSFIFYTFSLSTKNVQIDWNKQMLFHCRHRDLNKHRFWLNAVIVVLLLLLLCCCWCCSYSYNCCWYCCSPCSCRCSCSCNNCCRCPYCGCCCCCSCNNCCCCPFVVRIEVIVLTAVATLTTVVLIVVVTIAAAVLIVVVTLVIVCSVIATFIVNLIFVV